MTQTLPRTLTKPRKAARGVVEPPPVALPAPGTAPPCVVGVDLSLTATGVAWPNGDVESFGRAGLTGNKLSVNDKIAKLQLLAREIFYLITSRTGIGIAVVGMEMLPTARTHSQSERAYLWWRVAELLDKQAIPVIDIPPALIKMYISSWGDANKREVVAAVREHLPQFEIRRTGKGGKLLTTYDDNKADSATICAMLCDLLGHPLVAVPAAGRAALDKIQLPEGINR